jgi:hypothetical protein
MFQPEGFIQAAPRFPERISANVPKGLRAEARVVAEQNGMSLAEFARRALIRAIENPQAAVGALDAMGGRR